MRAQLQIILTDAAAIEIAKERIESVLRATLGHEERGRLQIEWQQWPPGDTLPAHWEATVTGWSDLLGGWPDEPIG